MGAHVGPVAAMKELTLDSAVATLRAGGVIAYPTEAVWGLGCDPSHEAAVHMVLRLKQRPIEKGMILVAAELSQLEGWVRLQALPDARQRAVLASWPGANTWILPAGPRAQPWITGEHSGIARRGIGNPVAALRVRSENPKHCAARALSRSMIEVSAIPIDLAEAFVPFGVHAKFAKHQWLSD